jgi:hypothetical protein
MVGLAGVKSTAPKNLRDHHNCTGGMLAFTAAVVLHVVESLQVEVPID